VHWVKPVRVAEVAFRGWGKEGLLRQASFKRLRSDKSGEDLAMPAKTTSSDDAVAMLQAAAQRQERRGSGDACKDHEQRRRGCHQSP